MDRRSLKPVPTPQEAKSNNPEMLYEAPQVTDLGTLADVTQDLAAGNSDGDGGGSHA